jgi:hypothetical protein
MEDAKKFTALQRALIAKGGRATVRNDLRNDEIVIEK